MFILILFRFVSQFQSRNGGSARGRWGGRGRGGEGWCGEYADSWCNILTFRSPSSFARWSLGNGDAGANLDGRGGSGDGGGSGGGGMLPPEGTHDSYLGHLIISQKETCFAECIVSSTARPLKCCLSSTHACWEAVLEAEGMEVGVTCDVWCKCYLGGENDVVFRVCVS